MVQCLSSVARGILRSAVRRRRLRSVLWLLLLCAGVPGSAGPVWVRGTLLSPGDQPWRLQVVVHNPSWATHTYYCGDVAGSDANQVKPLPAGQTSPWYDLSPSIAGVSTVRFLFTPLTGVKARFDIATANNEQAIVRSITEHDSGGVVTLRIPEHLVQDARWLLSVREDAKRRYDEVRAMHFPAGPLPKKIWCMTGFRSMGQYHSDPDIVAMDLDTICLLGMNGYWDQVGGETRKLAAARGLNYTTIYQRDVVTPPGYGTAEGVRLNWEGIEKYLDAVYQGPPPGMESFAPGAIITDIMDEPGGMPFGGAEFQQAFRAYLQGKGFTPAFFSKTAWEEISAPRFDFYDFSRKPFYGTRDAINMEDIGARRLFYWSMRFITEMTARIYAMATERVERMDVKRQVIGSRVNFGPPWLVDFGLWPSGTDAFEFGKVRGVTMAFNEDWIGLGSPRIPLEINTLLTDWTRGAMRPQNPLVGSYITRDADRTAVKLRTFGCLARECKFFDFYYYGPSYTFFDHWSDNLSMVRGVGEVTREIGQADELLWLGKAPKAEMALLYSRTWPLWKKDDTEQDEMTMVYLALLHAGIPIDIVSDEEVANGWFAKQRYQVLYVVNESIPAVTAQAIEQWVKGGGRLWASGLSGRRDEYNTPTEVWTPLRQAATAEAATARYGKGLVTFTSRFIGKEYIGAATEHHGTLARAIRYPAGNTRDTVTATALAAGVRPPAVTSVNQILAWPLWTKKQGVVLLANFTGDTAENVTVRFIAPSTVRAIRSIKQGKLAVKRDGQYTSCILPVHDVTDILIIN